MDSKRHEVLVMLTLTMAIHYIMMEVAVMQYVVFAFHYCMVNALEVVVVHKLA